MSRPELEVLVPSFPKEAHRELLAKLTRQLPFRCDWKIYYEGFLRKELLFWETPEGALVLTKIALRGLERHLWIEAIVGPGMIARRREIIRDCKVIAREYSCEAISGQALHRGLARLYEEAGAKPVSTEFLMRIG